MSVEYTDGKGRKYSSMASMLESAVEEVKEEVRADAERAARRETCPVHQQKATVKRTPNGFEIEACCEEFSEKIKAVALKSM
jgi:hypothetical protein